MNEQEILMNKIILKLTKQVTDLTLKLAESESKSEMFKELLEIRENEIKNLKGV